VINIKKLLAVGIILLFTGTIFTPGITANNPVSSKTIYVDDDNTEGPWDGTQEHPYQFIQDGVINANNSDIIFVNNGFYHENVNIDKPITLIGADIWNTTIDGDKSNHAVFIFNTTSVSISGFTIQNGFDGILVSMSRDVMIKNNLIKDNVVGIAVRWNSNNNVICNNEIRRNKNIGVLVDYVKQEKPNSFLMNNFIDNGKNAIAYGVRCQWGGNFWDDWVGLKFSFLNFLPYLVYFYPLNFDMNPAQEPYDISEKINLFDSCNFSPFIKFLWHSC
jgi:nitrous oxidase accessory protein NosD